MTTIFDPTGPIAPGWLALEASAGTGKTWSIAALATRLVAEEAVPLDQLLLVTFTRAATAELRDRVRRRLVTTRAHLAAVHAGLPPPDPVDGPDPVAEHLAEADEAELAQRIRRLDAALQDFDAATITTIHGFCQRVLAAAGFIGDIDPDAALVEDVEEAVQSAVHDLLVAQWAEVPLEDHEHRPKPTTGIAASRAVLGRPHATIRPGGDATDMTAGVGLARLAIAAAERVAAQTRAAGTLTFDDLLLRLDAALQDPTAGPAITEAMRRTFAAGMVDEFQDTDPVQWAILSRLFDARRLVVIGDPKQAIYRFRGADVAAYLKATTAGGTAQATLDRNRRSDPRLVAAVNRLFDGTAFGHPKITFAPVTPHHQATRLRLAGTDEDVEPPPLQVRVICDDPGAPTARAMVAADLAAETTRLLAGGAELVGADGGWQPLRAGDIAVLVRTNVEADQVKTALVEAGVHAVVNGVGSVLDTDAAADWQLLLDALDQPSSGSRVRALALSPVVGMRPDELTAFDEAADAQLHEQVHCWAQVLTDLGVASLVRTIAAETDLYARLLGQHGGDRWVVDFTHLGELLHTVSAGESTSPVGLRSWLEVQARRLEELPSEQRARRLESDARAVQIMTIHRSKGLEFPVVLCPYVSSLGMPPRVPLIHTEPGGGTVIDLGSPEERAARDAVTTADRGEHLRLLYVALTRAANRLVVWWWPVQSSKAYRHVALTKVLCCPDEGPGRVRADAEGPLMGDGATVRTVLDQTRGRLGSDIEIVEVPKDPVPVAVPPDADAPAALAHRSFTARIDRAWTRSSYTALTKPLPATTGAADHGTAVPRTPDVTPVVSDEADVELDTADEPVADAGHLPLPLADQPGGPRFGTLVHAILEHVDLDADGLGVALAVETHRQIRITGVSVPDPDGLAAGLLVACRTPLGPAFGDQTLAGIARRDRLDELTFELPLAHGGSDVTLSSVAGVLEDHLAPDDPFAGYVDALRDRSLARRVRGFLTGSIDLVLRRHVKGQPVFHVIDHKTNTFWGSDGVGTAEAPTTWRYRGKAMVQAMWHSHYLLQALLYQVALHRYLRWRQPAYDPQVHLGSVGYAFLRGLAGPDTPMSPLPGAEPVRCGMLAWRPPDGLVEALSDLLDEGRSR
jgi:exodeoxyribonuclease V beta subunit